MSASGHDCLAYLTDIEAQEIRDEFSKFADCVGRLVFWNGIPREWAQVWADEHGMLTLSSMMGPLMDKTSSRCPKLRKSPKAWKQYVKGASMLFAEHACSSGTITMLMESPYGRREPRVGSTYYNIEEPVLHGLCGSTAAERILCVHPAVLGAEEVRYEIWPSDRSLSWKRMYGPECGLRKHYKRRKSLASHQVRVQDDDKRT